MVNLIKDRIFYSLRSGALVGPGEKIGPILLPPLTFLQE